MKYAISNLNHTPFDLDDDIIMFNFDIHITEPEEMFIEQHGVFTVIFTSILKRHILIFIITCGKYGKI